MATSKSQIKAVRKWESENHEKITIYAPKGMKDRIKSSGNTLNGYILEAIKEKIEKDGI